MLPQLLLIGISAYIGRSFFYRSKDGESFPLTKKKSLRSRQLERISSGKDRDRRIRADKMTSRNVRIAGASLVLSTAGGLFFPPLALLSIPGIIYVSLSIYQKTFQSLRRGKIGTELLVSLTLTGGLLSGYYFVVSFAVFLFSLSFKLLQKVTEDSKDQLIDVFRRQPENAWVLINGTEVEMPLEEVELGRIVVVGGGEVIPVDGRITEGFASIDEQALTGEFRANEKVEGERVFASTVVLSGKIYITVEQTGDETAAAKIGRILNRTAEFKSSVQLRAEQLADRTVIPTLIASGVAFPFLGTMGALAIFNAHFRDQMTIVAPVSIMNFLSIASQEGILIKDGRIFDLLHSVDTLVFDKTGTLTEEQPEVGEIYPCAGYEKNEVLRWAAATEQKQQHPIAKALLQAARTLDIPTIDETEYTMGYGLAVRVDNKWIRTGSLRFMERELIPIPHCLRKIQIDCHELGHSLIVVAVEDIVIGAIELLPVIRPEIKKVLYLLRQRSRIKTMYIISGDHENPTKQLAASLHFDGYFAETLPEQKSAIIEQLQKEGKYVCYIGDGINDSIALKKAHVSISLCGASTAATDTAQIILMEGDLTQLFRTFELAQEYHKNINITFAAVLLPAIIGIGGVFLLHFGLIETIFLNLIGLISGVSNASLPLLKYNHLKGDREDRHLLMP